MLTRGVLMLCDTACPHVAHILQDIQCFMHWNMVEYLPYSLDLIPCDLCCSFQESAEYIELS